MGKLLFHSLELVELSWLLTETALVAGSIIDQRRESDEGRRAGFLDYI